MNTSYCLPKRPSLQSPPLTHALSQHAYDYSKPVCPMDHYKQWMNTNAYSPPTNTGKKQPNKQNKHTCTYPDCQWTFKRFEHLKRHMLVHTGERPHVCPHPGCDKRFSRSDNFHAHYRTHEKKVRQQKFKGEPHSYYPPSFVKHEDEAPKKPHACTHCDKRFRRLEHLKRHTRIHTQEQPFRCHFPGCLKTFSRSDNLTQHRKTHERRGNQEPLSLEQQPMLNWQPS